MLDRLDDQSKSTDPAVKEMIDGGYGFHGIWRNLIAWINALDVNRMKRRAGL